MKKFDYPKTFRAQVELAEAVGKALKIIFPEHMKVETLSELRLLSCRREDSKLLLEYELVKTKKKKSKDE
jgi:hypothetical protein